MKTEADKIVGGIREIVQFARKCIDAEDPLDEIEKRFGLDEFRALVVGAEYLLAVHAPVVDSRDPVEALKAIVASVGAPCPKCDRYFVGPESPICPNCGTHYDAGE
jgi:hypothetical protein